MTILLLVLSLWVPGGWSASVLPATQVVAPGPSNGYLWCDGRPHVTPQPPGMRCHIARRHFSIMR